MCHICEQEKRAKAEGTTEVWNPETEKVSIARLADAVRAASIANPDKIYERPTGGGCKYTHNTETDKMVPGCIVGQGIFDLTSKVVDNTTMHGAVNNSNWIIALGASSGEMDRWGDAAVADDPLTQYLVQWLRNVQGKQDDGQKWGDAVAYADRATRFAHYAD